MLYFSAIAQLGHKYFKKVMAEVHVSFFSVLVMTTFTVLKYINKLKMPLCFLTAV